MYVIKHFSLRGEIFSVFVRHNHDWIAMDSSNKIYSYSKKPQRNTHDDNIMWHLGDDETGNDIRVFELVAISENAERAMKSVGWTKSLRKLRRNR